MKKLAALLGVGALAFAGACAEAPTAVTPDSPVFAFGDFTTNKLAGSIYLRTFSGNFVASDDDQVCYELNELTGWGLTGELRGYKVDPPVGTNQGGVETLIDPTGKFLDWQETGNADVLGFIIKGGPNFNLYDYYSAVQAGYISDPTFDERLQSPQHGRNIPQISHYNYCVNPGQGEGHGCTPGYWRNHADRWRGVLPSANFNTTFGVNLHGAATLGQVISAPQTYGTFGFHAVAALLNAYSMELGPDSYGQFVEYPYTVAQVKAMVQEAVANGQTQGPIQALKDANEAGCPLSGSPANKV
jgi:hypothetical protein